MFLLLLLLVPFATCHDCAKISVEQRTNDECPPTPTTVSGAQVVPGGKICSGQLIFEEEFDQMNEKLWLADVSRPGASNGEFQQYVADSSISYVKSGVLYIKPSVNTTSGVIRSAQLRSGDGFAFKYGTVVVRAQTPAGDWLWPAIRQYPKFGRYGGWPVSGEFDLLETSGNSNSRHSSTPDISRVSQTLHWGPNAREDRTHLTSWNRFDTTGYNTSFHCYKMEWTPDFIRFTVDGAPTGQVEAGPGFWARGNFTGPNPWAKGTKMAPFDQEFYLTIGLAVGGTSGFFNDNIQGKPWKNGAGSNALQDFIKAKNQWLPTWKLDTDQAALKIDHVRIWAV